MECVHALFCAVRHCHSLCRFEPHPLEPHFQCLPKWKDETGWMSDANPLPGWGDGTGWAGGAKKWKCEAGNVSPL